MARLFDATGVSEVAARPYLSKGLRIIGYSRPIPQYLFAARGGLQKGLLLKLEKAMLLVNRLKDPGSVVGSIEPGADGLSKARDRDYDIVRALVKKERAGKGLLIR
jgi:ABC-type phosphate/phosphonate transport system substrate-binding protein